MMLTWSRDPFQQGYRLRSSALGILLSGYRFACSIPEVYFMSIQSNLSMAVETHHRNNLAQIAHDFEMSLFVFISVWDDYLSTLFGCD